MSTAEPGMNATLHVVICTYNRADQLVHTLDALVEQDAPHDGQWEVLVVDNNCTDGTDKLVDRYHNRLPGLRRVVEPRQGLTEARQRGFHATEAPWVAFIDDDCVPEPGWVTAALTHVNTRPDMAAFNGRNILHFNDDQPRPWIHPQMFAADAHGSDEASERGYLHGAGLVLRRDAVERSGWLEAPQAEDRRGNSLVSGGDNELAVRALAASKGGGLWYLPDCRMHHTVDGSRLGLRYLTCLNYRLAEAGALLKAMGSETPRSWHRFMIRNIAWRFVAATGLRRDPMVTDGGGARARILSLTRASGTAAGYLKLAARPRRLRREVIGVATPGWVAARHPQPVESSDEGVIDRRITVNQ